MKKTGAGKGGVGQDEERASGERDWNNGVVMTSAGDEKR
jgi:hypothetical protein